MKCFLYLPFILFSLLCPETSKGQAQKSAELVLDAKATLGEGAIWDYLAGELLWIDIEKGRLFMYSPSTRILKAKELGQKVGTVVPAMNGSIIVALKNGIYAFSRKDSSLHRIIPNPEKDLPNNRFNDGKCDPSGRFWVGTMSMGGEPLKGSLYRINPDGSITRMIGSVTTSNGIVWTSNKKKMYYIDTPTSRVMEYNYNDSTGAIGSARVAIIIPKEMGYPDGMTIDSDDKLWIAHWGGYGVYKWDPIKGTLLEKVAVPAKNVTSCAFGGDKLEILYITTARQGNSEAELSKYPSSGGLFRVKTGSKGLPANYFGNTMTQ